MKTVDLSETIAACDLKVGRSRHLIEYMKVCVFITHANVDTRFQLHFFNVLTKAKAESAKQL